MRTRSKTKKIRENVRRLPHEVEATLPSWVKCTDPIPREILEEVRSTVTTWMKNVRNYVEETETYILNDEHTPPEIVDEGWAFFVGRIYCLDPYIYSSYIHSYAEGVGRFGKPGGFPVRIAIGPYRGKVIHTGWSRFIRRMILSDVNIIHRGIFDPMAFEEEDVVGSFHRTDIVFERHPQPRGRVKLVVYFHERLSSEIKDEICSKLASALRALKSRISRICGINELERRTQSH